MIEDTLSKIFGVIWIVLGAIGLIRPHIIKTRLQRKITRRIRRVVNGFLIVFGIVLMAGAMKNSGLLPKIIGIIGVVIAIKVILWVTSKTSEKLFSWLGERPLIFFRAIASFFLAVGLALILF